MSVTDELESKHPVCEFVRNAQLKENCNVENPASLAALVSRAPGHQRNILVAGFTCVRGR
jgi:hypothetical protein